MRDVMTTKGGFCASGGPYVIGSHCDSGQVKLIGFGMVGLFVFGALYFAFMAWYEAPLLGPLLFMWAALFGALGWNFIDLGAIHEPSDVSGTGGWVVSGVVFWAMALGGLVPAVLLAVGWFRRGGEAEEPLFTQPLVRAGVAAPGQQHDPNVPARLVIPQRTWEEPPT